ncbi:MAG: chemotaxis protein [Syntrophus sp. (in: bacteria)]|nr:chemotaxis protein [Syntrophus sp. (in: bacteria)]
MKNMKLSTKLICGFLAVSLIGAIVGGWGLLKINQVVRSETKLYEQMTVPLSQLGHISTYFQRVRINARDMVEAEDPARIKHFAGRIDELSAAITKNAEAYEKTLLSEEEKALFRRFVESRKVYRAHLAKMTEYALENKDAEARAIMAGEGFKAAQDEQACIDEMMAGKIGSAKATTEAAANAAVVTAILTLMGVALSLFLGILLSLSISRALNKVIAGLNDGADQIAAAAGQVSAASQSLAEGTSEQASSLEETSSSLEEMSSMTKQNADNAAQAKAMTAEATVIVEKVNRHMQDMAAAVGEIARSSEETGKIIKTIDEIAFQTNLLALNAAVEAARAGEAGAGFAVVADEVRNLALRASEAAKNTNSLIENTIKAVRKGNELTNITSEAFKENTLISMKIAQLVDEIAAASEEQARGISQVNMAVSEMDKVTQSTAANAEESAAAAEELNAQAEQMTVYVGDLVAVVGGNSRDTKGGGKGLALTRRAARQPLTVTERKAAQPLMGERRGPKNSRGKQLIPLKEEEFNDF